MGPQHGARRRAAAVLALFLALSGCAYAAPDPAPPAPAPGPMDSLDSQARLLIDNGAVAAVVQVRWPGGEWSRAYGVRDLDTKTPAQPDDRVEVASVTKSMTAVTVLKLVDDGLIGLDSPVNEVIPGFTTSLRPPAPITVRQLLNHTSGLPEYLEALPPDADPRALAAQTVTMERALELAGALPWKAGTVGDFNYSNTNYAALGLLVQTLRHRPFVDVFREEVVAPLRLSKTSMDRVDGHEADLIHGYVTLRGERIDTTDNAFVVGSPAGGAVMSVGDVNTFFGALFGGRLVSKSSLTEMKKNAVVRLPYGLGVWMHSDGCTSGQRYEGRGSFSDQQTIAVTSEDGRYQATMSVSIQPLATEREDSDTARKRDLYGNQIESSLNETLDRLCQS